MVTKKRLIEQLIDYAMSESFIAPMDYYKRHPEKDPRKVGEKILALSPADRAELEKLTVADLNHRVDEILKYWVAPGTVEGHRRGRLGKHLDEQAKAK